MRQVNDENTKGLETLASATTVIPFWLVEYHMMMARGHVNNLPDTLFFVDTGLADYGFLISRPTLKAIGMTINWDNAQESYGGGGKIRYVTLALDRVTLGEGSHSLSKTDVRTELHEEDMEIFRGALGFEVGGLISHDFFKGVSLTLDFAKMRMIIRGKDGTSSTPR